MPTLSPTKEKEKKLTSCNILKFSQAHGFKTWNFSHHKCNTRVLSIGVPARSMQTHLKNDQATPLPGASSASLATFPFIGHVSCHHCLPRILAES